MITSVRDKEIDGWFPNAAADGYELTSDSTSDYNCIAWAAGVTDLKWWPIDKMLRPVNVDWPDGVSTSETLDSFVAAYKTLGYKECGSNGQLTRGYEKIAIYTDFRGTPTHAARQLSDGVWTSKLGGYRDIHHTSPHAIEDDSLAPRRNSDYGTVAIYMMRKRKAGDICLRKPGVADTTPSYDESRLRKLIRLVHCKLAALLPRR
jgi:hypothetical protein